jgi:hypothetical protein
MGSQYGMTAEFIPYHVLNNLFRRYYGHVGAPPCFFTISINGSTPERSNGRNNKEDLAQQMLWSKTDLGPGRHIVTLAQDDVNGTALHVDFFRSVINEARL